jgi:hypothetical protein
MINGFQCIAKVVPQPAAPRRIAAVGACLSDSPEISFILTLILMKFIL